MLRSQLSGLNVSHAIAFPLTLRPLAPRLSIKISRQAHSDIRSHSRGGVRPSSAPDMPFETIERAQGMPGEGLTHGPPATKKAGGSHHRCSRSTGIPCAIVLTLIRDLPGDRLVVPVFATILRIIASATMRTHCAGHQHRDARTTRLHVRIRLARPRERSRLPRQSRLPHPTSRIVTIARNAPLVEAGSAT
jgi:hypothetical protein